MAVYVSNLIDVMRGLAPEGLALDYDNVGLILGDPNEQVNRVLLALDADDAVVAEAVDMKAELIITHHPPIFKPIKSITKKTALGRRIIKLINHGVSVYAAHTNLDIARMGTNDALFVLLGLADMEPLGDGGVDIESSLGRIGTIKGGMLLHGLCHMIKELFDLRVITYVGDPNKIIYRVGLCTGSASDPKYLMQAAEKGCDVFITGDVTYHNAQAALDLDLAMIDGTHFATEAAVLVGLKEYLERRFGGTGIEIHVSKASRSVLRYT